MNGKSLEEKCAWMRARMQEKTRDDPPAKRDRPVTPVQPAHQAREAAPRPSLPRIEAVRVTIAPPGRDLPEEEANRRAYELAAYWLALTRKKEIHA